MQWTTTTPGSGLSINPKHKDAADDTSTGWGIFRRLAAHENVKGDDSAPANAGYWFMHDDTPKEVFAIYDDRTANYLQLSTPTSNENQTTFSKAMVLPRRLGSDRSAHLSLGCADAQRETGGCNDCHLPKPVDAEWGAFSDWSSCSCEGLRERTREIAVKAEHGGKPLQGDARETETCTPDCEPDAVDCEFSAWTSWQACSKACGGGQRYRSRTIHRHASGQNAKPCTGSLEETETCNTHTTAIRQWIASGTRGEGTRARTPAMEGSARDRDRSQECPVLVARRAKKTSAPKCNLQHPSVRYCHAPGLLVDVVGNLVPMQH